MKIVPFAACGGGFGWFINSDDGDNFAQSSIAYETGDAATAACLALIAKMSGELQQNDLPSGKSRSLRELWIGEEWADLCK